MNFEHYPLEYIEIMENGEETARNAHFWADGPRIGSQWAVWVLPDPARAEPGPSAVAVVQANRRHRIGRVRKGHWQARGGRYVDRGVTYTEVHPGSPTGLLTVRRPVPPTSIKVDPLDDMTMWLLSGLCQRCGADPAPGEIFCEVHGVLPCVS